MNTIGNLFKITTFGESHGKALGCVIDGCPPGIKIKKKYISKELNKRKPGKNKYVTQRKEEDNFKIVSGIYKKRTTGTPIGIIIKNYDFVSKDYKNLENIFRPGHADYSYNSKYGIRDHRGGGRSSARTTVSIVAAGSICKKIIKDLYNIRVFSYIKKIGNKKINFNKNLKYSVEKHLNKKIKNILNSVIKKKDSIGCLINLKITGIMKGLGEPLYDKFDSELSKHLINLNAVKAVEIGKCNLKKMGSENNDFFFKEGIYKNNSGGIIGGISTGQDICINIKIKPTSSIFKKQKTVNKKLNETFIKIQGRHDPCVGLRAIPIIESITSIILINFIIKQKLIIF
ncbi:chorismate synthase [Candidatus Vidania fulgoroideorum]